MLTFKNALSDIQDVCNAILQAKLELVDCKDPSHRRYLRDEISSLGCVVDGILKKCSYNKELVSLVESCFPNICPDGEFTAYKKIGIQKPYAFLDRGIAELIIPADAKRVSGFGRKCRSDKAIVRKIFSIEGNYSNRKSGFVEEVIGKEIKDEDSFGLSLYCYKKNYKQFIYEPGRAVIADSFDENRFNECSNGIHFFLTLQDALEFQY